MLNWIRNHKAMLIAVASLWLGFAAGHVTLGEALSGTLLAVIPGAKIPGLTAPRVPPTSTVNPRF